MKRLAMLVLISTLAMAATMFGQYATPATQSPTPAPAATTPTPAAAPLGGKTPPQAKTQPEYDAYTAAVANTDPAALEKAADDFATKFPTSELRVLIYRSAMRAYQGANNADKMLDVAHKILNLDPNDPEALIGAAEVLTERTRDTDLDKDQKYAEAMKDAQLSIQTVDTDSVIPAGTPQAKIDEYKGSLRSSAYSIIGAIQSNQEKYADAEASFRKSLDAYPSSPDPVVVLRLSIALDKQAKYPEALKEANRAVELTQDGTNAGTLARRERDRLVQLTGGAPPAGTAAPATSPTMTPPTSPATPAPKTPGV